MYSMIPSPLPERINQNGVVKPGITNWEEGKVGSILVSQIKSKPTLALTRPASIMKLFLIPIKTSEDKSIQRFYTKTAQNRKRGRTLISDITYFWITSNVNWRSVCQV